MFDHDDLKQRLATYREVTSYLKTPEGLEWFCSISDPEALLAMKFCPSLSSYGGMFEERFARQYRLERVPSSEDRGDLRNLRRRDLYYELKLSGKECPSWRQCRPHQRLEAYILGAYDEHSIRYYYIPDEQAKSLIYAQGVYTHGRSEEQKELAEYDLTYRRHFERYRRTAKEIGQLLGIEYEDDRPVPESFSDGLIVLM